MNIKKCLITLVFIFVLNLSISIFAHSGDDANGGINWSIAPWNFDGVQEWASFYCPSQKHHATAVMVNKNGTRDESRVERSAGIKAYAETGWHYNPNEWNWYYGHD
jgi:hypothetical protein